MIGRRAVWASLIVVIGTVAVTVAFTLALILASPPVQALMVRAVAVSLVIFLALLFVRYFSLLWFSYLGHAERNVLGTEEYLSLIHI